MIRVDQVVVRTACVLGLQEEGYKDWDGLYLKENGDSSSVLEFKATRRKFISQNYTIIANVGDQFSDLNAAYAERTFKQPNPFYFIP